MSEKIKKWFDPQTSDDAFVEAATDVSARQKMIDKLVKARAKISRLVFLAMPLYMGLFLIALFAPTTPAMLKPQTLGVAGQVLMIMGLAISHTIIDLQIKFLKALEEGARQAVFADN